MTVRSKVSGNLLLWCGNRGPLVCLVLFSFAGSGGVAAQAGKLNVGITPAGTIEVSAQDTSIDRIIGALGDLLGFEVHGEPGLQCAPFSGKIAGKIGDILGRLDTGCNFITTERFGVEGGSTISSIRFVNTSSAGSAAAAVVPDTTRYSYGLVDGAYEAHAPGDSGSRKRKQNYLSGYKLRMERQEREVVEKLWNWSSSTDQNSPCENSSGNC